MNKYVKMGLGLMAGVAASIAVFRVIKRRRLMHEEKPPFAEAAESGEV